MKTTSKFIIFCFIFIGLPESVYAQTPDEASFQLGVEQLHKTPNDDALREYVVKLAQELNPLPVLPDAAVEFEERAQSAFKNVNTPADCINVAQEYEKAVAAAPWVPGYYADLCIIYQMAEKYAEAKKSCEFFLAGSPTAQDARDTRIRIDGLELAMKRADKPTAEEMRPGKAFRDCPDCPEMVVIPEGSFEMGSNSDDRDERPAHLVTIIGGFALGKTEVTQGQWKAIMGNNPSKFTSCGDDCPVEQVSYDDAEGFIQKINAKTGKQYRLPSEAEWEYSCRAGGMTAYCGSDDLNNVGWHHGILIFGGNSDNMTHLVATKQANAFGLYDMSGNVSEWVEDGYHTDYNGAPLDGSVWQGDGLMRVHRGGSWNILSMGARAAKRSWSGPAIRSVGYGFRIARML